MKEISLIGLDLSKSVFQIHGVDSKGKEIMKKKFNRKELVEFLSNLKPCTVGLEACGGSNYWARKIKSMNHEVKMIAPQFVKPFVKSNKNDARDAAAIAEAVSRPSMKFVPIKTIHQQDVQSIHRIRQSFVKSRSGLVNMTRGLLHEYGIVFPKGITQTRKMMIAIVTGEIASTGDMTELTIHLINTLYEQLKRLDEQISLLDKKTEIYSDQNEICKRIKTIPGVGPIISTAIYASAGDGSTFKSGRHMAAWLGIVPKHDGTGGKIKIKGISKRGNPYLRMMLIHGARNVVMNSGKKNNKFNDWVTKLKERRGFNKACVAVANKNARIIWALLNKKEDYIARVA